MTHEQKARALADRHVSPAMCDPAGYQYMIVKCAADITQALRTAHEEGFKAGAEAAAKLHGTHTYKAAEDRVVFKKRHHQMANSASKAWQSAIRSLTASEPTAESK